MTPFAVSSWIPLYVAVLIFRFAGEDSNEAPETNVNGDASENVEESIEMSKEEQNNSFKKRKRSDSNADFQQPPPTTPEEASPPKKAQKNQVGAFQDASKNSGSH